LRPFCFIMIAFPSHPDLVVTLRIRLSPSWFLPLQSWFFFQSAPFLSFLYLLTFLSLENEACLQVEWTPLEAYPFHLSVKFYSFVSASARFVYGRKNLVNEASVKWLISRKSFSHHWLISALWFCLSFSATLSFWFIPYIYTPSIIMTCILLISKIHKHLKSLLKFPLIILPNASFLVS
jgi:hypothetical protein